MRIYYDTEFVDDGITIDLISIGMVAEDGSNYYAIEDNPRTIQRAVEHPWLQKNVVPYLPIKVLDQSYGEIWAPDRYGRVVCFSNTWEWDRDHPAFHYVKTRKEIASEVLQFLRNFENTELWAWYGAYDHVILAQLFGSMINLPTGVPRYTNDLKSETVRLGDIRVPEQTVGLHNALEDAWWNRRVGEYLRSYENLEE